MEVLQKSPVTRKFYRLSSLSLDDKIRLGFDKAVVDELKTVNEEEKKSRVKRRKDEDND